jgi:hypothetical protein
VLASNIPIWLTVPQVDVHCGNSTAAEFVDTPLLGAPKVTDWRAYDPPLTSVPVPASVGSAV